MSKKDEEANDDQNPKKTVTAAVPATDGAVSQHVAEEKLMVPLTLKVGSKRT